MRRHPSLRDLSRDHHFLLLHCREIKWALKGDPRAAPVGQVRERFLHYWKEGGEPHLQEEEALLLPLCTESPAGELRSLAEQVQADHGWLRARVATLDGVARGKEMEALLGQIARRLHDHVRFEERVLFERLQQLLPEESLKEIGVRSRLFRERWRPGPAAREF